MKNFLLMLLLFQITYGYNNPYLIDFNTGRTSKYFASGTKVLIRYKPQELAGVYSCFVLRHDHSKPGTPIDTVIKIFENNKKYSPNNGSRIFEWTWTIPTNLENIFYLNVYIHNSNPGFPNERVINNSFNNLFVTKIDTTKIFYPGVGDTINTRAHQIKWKATKSSKVEISVWKKGYLNDIWQIYDTLIIGDVFPQKTYHSLYPDGHTIKHGYYENEKFYYFNFPITGSYSANGTYKIAIHDFGMDFRDTSEIYYRNREYLPGFCILEKEKYNFWDTLTAGERFELKWFVGDTFGLLYRYPVCTLCVEIDYLDTVGTKIITPFKRVQTFVENIRNGRKVFNLPQVDRRVRCLIMVKGSPNYRTTYDQICFQLKPVQTTKIIMPKVVNSKIKNDIITSYDLLGRRMIKKKNFELYIDCFDKKEKFAKQINIDKTIRK